MEPEPLYLADATLVRNFTQAGRPCTEALLSRAGTSLQMVHEVREELRKHETSIPTLGWFLSELPEEQVHHLSKEESTAAAEIARALSEPEDHPEANLGEAATIVLAKRLVLLHSDLCLITDDTGGRNYAKARGLSVVGTTAIVKKLVAGGELTADDGARVGREHFRNPQRQRQFHLELKSLAGGRPGYPHCDMGRGYLIGIR